MSMYHRFINGDFVDDPTEIFLTFDCYHHTTTTTTKSYNSGVVFVLLLIYLHVNAFVCSF